MGTGRECVENLIQAFKTPVRERCAGVSCKAKALSDPTVWDHGNNRSFGVRGADSFQEQIPHEPPKREGQAQESNSKNPL